MSLELSGTTGVKGVAGSVSAPSIVGDDTNTGISFPAADTIKFSTGGVERMSITNSGVSGVGGKILQVVQAVKNDVSSTSSESFSDVGSLSVNITPSSSSNKILVNWHGTYSSNTNRNGHIRLARDSNELIYVGDQGATSAQARASNSMSVSQQYFAESFAGTFLDSPNTTSQITYKLRFAAGDEGYTIYIGRMMDNSNEFSRSKLPASITVMEVAA